jgi:tetratricopeptide (TPR) repeat protein
MEEAPDWGAPHAIAARWLFASGRIDQALLEIRAAEQRQASRGHKALCEILSRFPQMTYIERAAPSEARRVAYLNRTVRCPGLPAELRAEIDRAIFGDEPAHAEAVIREAKRLAARERSSEAITRLQEAIKHNPDDDRLLVALVRAHLNDGKPEQARLALQDATSGRLTTRPLLEAQASIEAALRETDAMRGTLTRLRGQARGEPKLVARSFVLEGELEASLGNIDEAIAAYSAADEASPASNALQRAATLAIKSGRPTQARRIYRTLCRRTPDGPACAHEARLSKESGPAPPERAVP